MYTYTRMCHQDDAIYNPGLAGTGFKPVLWPKMKLQHTGSHYGSHFESMAAVEH